MLNQKFIIGLLLFAILLWFLFKKRRPENTAPLPSGTDTKNAHPLASARQEAERIFLDIHAEFVGKFLAFSGLLKERYYIEKEIDTLNAKKLKNETNQPSMDLEQLLDAIADQKLLIADMDRFMKEPDQFFKKKHYDPIDNSPLMEVAVLTFTHPTYKRVEIVINRSNIPRYDFLRDLKTDAKPHKTPQQDYLIRYGDTNNVCHRFDADTGVIQMLQESTDISIKTDVEKWEEWIPAQANIRNSKMSN